MTPAQASGTSKANAAAALNTPKAIINRVKSRVSISSSTRAPPATANHAAVLMGAEYPGGRLWP